MKEQQKILDAQFIATAWFNKLIRKQRGNMGWYIKELIVEHSLSSNCILERLNDDGQSIMVILPQNKIIQV